jgi:hypothetical protein
VFSLPSWVARHDTCKQGRSSPTGGPVVMLKAPLIVHVLKHHTHRHHNFFLVCYCIARLSQTPSRLGEQNIKRRPWRRDNFHTVTGHSNDALISYLRVSYILVFRAFRASPPRTAKFHATCLAMIEPPTNEKQKLFSKCQEGARNAVERVCV